MELNGGYIQRRPRVSALHTFTALIKCSLLLFRMVEAVYGGLVLAAAGRFGPGGHVDSVKLVPRLPATTKRR